MKKFNNKKTIITSIVYVLIIVFLAQYLRSIDLNQLKAIDIDYRYLLAASLVSLAFRYWGVFIWKNILTDLGAKNLPSFRTLSSVYSKAWMGRYIPGTVTWIAGKVYFAASYGISKKRLVTASVLEGALQIVAIFAISLMFLGLDPRLNAVPDEFRSIALLLGVVSLVALTPAVFNKIIVLAARVFSKGNFETTELKSNNKTVIKALLFYSVGYFISGISFFLLVESIYPIGIENALFVAAAFSIAAAIGMASFITPSGLGVRESVQLLLLPIIMPKEAALAVTIIARLWSVVVDILFAAISIQIKGKKVSSSSKQQ